MEVEDDGDRTCTLSESSPLGCTTSLAPPVTAASENERDIPSTSQEGEIEEDLELFELFKGSGLDECDEEHDALCINEEPNVDDEPFVDDEPCVDGEPCVDNEPCVDEVCVDEPCIDTESYMTQTRNSMLRKQNMRYVHYNYKMRCYS